MAGLLLLVLVVGALGGLVLLVGLVLGACGRWCSGWAEDDRSDCDRRWDETVDDLLVLGPGDD